MLKVVGWTRKTLSTGRKLAWLMVPGQIQEVVESCGQYLMKDVTVTKMSTAKVEVYACLDNGKIGRSRSATAEFELACPRDPL